MSQVSRSSVTCPVASAPLRCRSRQHTTSRPPEPSDWRWASAHASTKVRGRSESEDARRRPIEARGFGGLRLWCFSDFLRLSDMSFQLRSWGVEDVRKVDDVCFDRVSNGASYLRRSGGNLLGLLVSEHLFVKTHVKNHSILSILQFTNLHSSGPLTPYVGGMGLLVAFCACWADGPVSFNISCQIRRRVVWKLFPKKGPLSATQFPGTFWDL